MRRSDRILWGASAGLAAWSLWFAWTTWGRTPPQPESTHAAALAPIDEPTPTPWLAAHFSFPFAPQGSPPAGWSTMEASLDPATCGTCHTQQYADWKASWHANAMGPGVLGLLVDFDGTDDAQVAKCQACHAPLAEQHAANAAYVPDLRDDGLTCAACHVRGWTRFGPPKDGPALDGAPHGGFVAKDEFVDSQFCARCHDFKPDQRSLEGKLFQETWGEWLHTDYAGDGVSCQDCHMPAGRHLWKGVHDPEMVRRAVGARAAFSLEGGSVRGALDVTNVGAGHRLPTYTTPELLLTIDQLDADGNALPGTRREGVIGRRLDRTLTTELFDTRLMPGETHSLAYEAPFEPRATRIRARVECRPDEAYTRLYQARLDRDTSNGRALIETALANSLASRFVIWEETTEPSR